MADVAALATRIQQIRATKEELISEHSPLQAEWNQVKFLNAADASRKAFLEAQAAEIMAEEAVLLEQIQATPGLERQLELLLTNSNLVTSTGAVEQADRAGKRIAPPETGRILCCRCGVSTEPNDARVCLDCLDVDITVGIPRQGVVHQCRSCKRYLGDQNQWLACEWESPPLLALCLKKIPMKTVRLVESKFIWTEPHCRRIKVQIRVEREVMSNAILRQSLIVEFVVGSQQCLECTKSVTPHLWISMVQVRQRTDHKRTILFLEQLVLKHNAHSNCVNIIDVPDGMDFCFGKPSHAQQFIEWIQSFFPVDVHSTATQLVSHDAKSNTYHNKYVTLCDIAPICRDDLVFIPKKMATALGGIPQMMLCRKISTAIHLVDPYTLRGVDIENRKFWTTPFTSCLVRRDLTDFMVLDVTPVPVSEMKAPGVTGRLLTQYFRLVEVEVARLKDLGVNDERTIVRSHLGHMLKAGDIVQGYDLARKIGCDHDKSPLLEKSPFTIVLVRKQASTQARNWLLRQLPKVTESPNGKPATKLDDIEIFKQDLEANAEMREHVGMYKDPRVSKNVVVTNELATLMDGLTINDDLTNFI